MGDKTQSLHDNQIKIMTRTKKSNQFSVFGTRPANSIYLPDIPYSVRLNCKDGGLFIGGFEAQHRKTNPDQKIDISIVKVSKFYGNLGKTENTFWIQLFFIPAPGVDGWSAQQLQDLIAQRQQTPPQTQKSSLPAA